MPPPPQSSRRRAQRGVSWIGWLLLLALLVGGYLAWVWVPVYYAHYAAKQVVRDFMNQAVRNKADEVLVLRMTHRLATVDTLVVAGEDGAPVKVPAVDVTPDQVIWERDLTAVPPMIRVAFEYTRPVVYPLLDRTEDVTFSIDLSQDLEAANWGSSR
jgi:hypothetical protein